MGSLSEKEQENALNEVRILASIDHPNIISYKETFYDKESESLCIVMEYANAGDAYQLMCSLRDKHKCFTEEEIWRIFIQTARGLQQLHDMKIMHRDLKSANIFLFSDGSVKLGDLNVSKVMNNNLEFTQTGTPYYASPEVWKDKPYNYKSDIWSLGCVMYELICQKPPFDAESMDELYKAVIKGKFDPIPLSYSNALHKVISSLIRVSASKRPSCKMILNDQMVRKWSMKILNQHQSSTKELPSFGSISTHPYRSTNQSVLIKTIKITKMSQNLPGPRYETDDRGSVSVNEIRRESDDVYSSLIKKPPKGDSVNISVKRSRRQKSKRNYDYLEVEISDPNNDQVDISCSRDKTKISMKRSINRVASVEDTKIRKQKRTINEHSYVDPNRSKHSGLTLNRSLQKNNGLNSALILKENKTKQSSRSIKATKKDLSLKEPIRKPKIDQKRLPNIHNLSSLEPSMAKLNQSPINNEESNRSISMMKAMNMLESPNHDKIVQKLKLRRKMKEYQLPYINQNLSNKILASINHTSGKYKIRSSLSNGRNSTVDSHTSSKRSLPLQNENLTPRYKTPIDKHVQRKLKIKNTPASDVIVIPKRAPIKKQIQMNRVETKRPYKYNMINLEGQKNDSTKYAKVKQAYKDLQLKFGNQDTDSIRELSNGIMGSSLKKNISPPRESSQNTSFDIYSQFALDKLQKNQRSRMNDKQVNYSADQINNL